MKKKIVIVGGGPAGLSAALGAVSAGILPEDILIIERDCRLGGILNQCIHNGFGLHTFKEELTGPEYAQRFIDLISEKKIPYKSNTMVMSINSLKNVDKRADSENECGKDLEPDLIKTGFDKHVVAMNGEEGIINIYAQAVILAMGCRERPRGALNIPGYRPAGIYSAGTAQYYVNIEGKLPGKNIVILGSGDIGLIMARRMTLEGAKVQAVVEIMPRSGGLKRNIVQCLDDFDIPLLLSHTVVDIKGKERVSSVTVAKVDEKCIPIRGTEIEYECDTLLLSCGLIPENELSVGCGIELDNKTAGPIVNEGLETNIEGIFACGNVLQVHGLVDDVSAEADIAGKNAAAYIRNIVTDSKTKENEYIHKENIIVKNNDDNVINEAQTLTCIGCPKGCELTVEIDNDEIIAVSGNTCPKGEKYARSEFTNPKRIVTSIVKVEGGNIAVAAVKTREAIPKNKISECMDEIRKITVKAPVNISDIIVKNVADTGVDVIATKKIDTI